MTKKNLHDPDAPLVGRSLEAAPEATLKPKAAGAFHFSSRFYRF